MVYQMKNCVRLFCVLFFVFLFASLQILAVPAYATSKQQELESNKQQAQSELDRINEKIKNHDSIIQDVKEKQAALQQQSALITQQIDFLIQQISLTEEQLQQKQAEVDEMQQDIDRRWSDFKQRMIAMQQLHDRGAVAVLANCTDLYQLLTFNAMLEEITLKDNQVLEDLTLSKQKLANERDILAQQQQQLQGQQNQLNGKISELAASIQSTGETISAEEAAKQADEVAAAEARKQLDAAANALDNYLRKQNNNYANTNVQFNSSLGFISPLSSYKYRTCAYGGIENHKGVDWAAPNGTPIYAAADGVVTVAKFDPSYGNYVQVYHGADESGTTYATLYAHMNGWPSVSAGQQVKRGDLLGYVGTTGNSTGNHLHLEIRVNGIRTDPENYIPRPG